MGRSTGLGGFGVGVGLGEGVGVGGRTITCSLLKAFGLTDLALFR